MKFTDIVRLCIVECVNVKVCCFLLRKCGVVLTLNSVDFEAHCSLVKLNLSFSILCK